MTDPSRAPAGDGGRGPDAGASGPDHLVITVHGIRTFGDWQSELKGLLREAEPGVKVLNYQFGYFSAIAFLVPPLRWLVARRFRNVFVRAIEGMPAGSRIDVVAHSFGTYLAASALPHVPEGRSIDTVILAGSVLRPSFPWYKIQERAPIGRLVNECGWEDSILVLCQFCALMMGMAGRVGFQGMVGENFVNRYYRFGHGGYFERRRPIMRENWLPLLTRHDPIPRIDERPRLTPWGGVKLFLINNLHVLKVAGAVLIALALVLIPLDWAHKADYQRRVKRFAHIARLANAARIPGRDPGHVRELLRIDADAHDGAEAIDRALGPEAMSDEADEDEPDPAWWERLPGLRDVARDGYRARQRHAQANAQLVAGKQGHASDQKARVLYEDAIRSYKLLAADDPAYGSYALCLVDYATLLGRVGLYKDASEQFRAAREDVFPKGPKGDYPDRPHSLLVDALCGEARMLQNLEDWDAAAKRLWDAHRAGEKDDEFESYTFNELAWLSMQRLEVARAVDYFLKAKEPCERRVDEGDALAKARLFHIRHGLAMAERLRGRPEEAYDLYEQIIEELQGHIRKDFDLDPKQRRDLADRLVNSMERRADVWLFARPPRADSARNPLARVQADYQQAIVQVGNDDLNIKARLLHKKVIARCFLALQEEAPIRPSDGLVSSAVAPPAGAGRAAERADAERELLDAEFAEAERTYLHLSPEMKKELKVYHQVAASCMKLRAARRGGAARPGDATAQAAGQLRSVAAEHARRCDTLTRDVVEMLLVAFEILLEPGVERKDDLRRRDASTMLTVLGISTRATSHGELAPYTDRFQRLAAVHLLPPAGAGATAAAGEGTQHLPTVHVERPRPARGDVLFFLRLSPTRSLSIVDDPPVPAPPPDPSPAEIAEAITPGAK